MNKNNNRECYTIADQLVCRGEHIVVQTTKEEIHGKLVSATMDFIILEILQSKAIITINRIVRVTIK